jgi:hypothetical protein
VVPGKRLFLNCRKLFRVVLASAAMHCTIQAVPLFPYSRVFKSEHASHSSNSSTEPLT